jgi:hypothetical protein
MRRRLRSALAGGTVANAPVTSGSPLAGEVGPTRARPPAGRGSAVGRGQVKPESGGADGRGMRIRRLSASGALVVISAVGVVAAGYAEAPAGATAIRGPQAHGRQGGLCIIALPQGLARRQGNWSAAGGSPPVVPPTRSRSASGDVSVTIPSTVFIRVGRKRIVVTTNTGVPPVSSDEFWVLAHGSASPADASMRAEVLTGCTSSPPTHGSGKHGSGLVSKHRRVRSARGE